jgi:hypothetical protein
MNATLTKLRAYLSGYCHFADQDITLPLALWIAGTYIFETFDSYPYLVITARVKRAGKTRLSELIGFTSNMPFNVAGASAPSLFRKIADDKPTILWDEAEQLSSEANDLVRAFLNVGYRKGQTIPRVGKGGVAEWPTYCPKAFVLIGDVYDTLRDRSIICEMQRGEPKKRFSYETAKEDGLAIADELRALCALHLEHATDIYCNTDIPFLTNRDAEIWRPLFAMCSTFEKESMNTIMRLAADMSAEKTNPYRYEPDKNAEAQAATEEYGKMLLRDMLTVCASLKGYGRDKRRALSSVDAIAALKSIPTAPWRKFYSVFNQRAEGHEKSTPGLVPTQLADLLGQFGIHPTLIRINNKVFRGYDAKHIEDAAKKWKIQ